MSPADLWINISLRLQQLGWVEWLDLLLVTVALFLILTAMQRAQATVMLRGLGVIAALLLFSTLFLSLPAFSLLVRIFFVFLLIALPVVFQRQLRVLFEDLGRSIGLAPRSRRRKTEELMHPLVRAVEQMAAEQIGALIVLEGEVDLNEIAETGLAIDGHVSSELLRGTFVHKNPLHDGAVLIRGQRVVAAACVLPVARGLINADRSLGTRHRAAVGISQRSDALVIVVSEETGTISAAENGELIALPDGSALRDRLLHFARQENPDSSTLLVRTGDETLAALGEEAFDARLSLGDVSAGVHQLPIEIITHFEAPVQIVDIQPERVEVHLDVRRRADIREVGVAILTDVPLDVPEAVSVHTRDGQAIATVQVDVGVSPRRGNINLTRPVELPPGAEEVGVTVRPEVVELLLSGPLPTLQEIQARPALARVVIGSVEVRSGESVEQVPEVIVPEGVRAELVTRKVTLSRP